MRAADEVIKVLDPRRDTGVWDAVLYNSLLRCIITFFSYSCSQTFYMLFVYLFCYILLSIYTVGFCNVMEHISIDKGCASHIKRI